MRGAQAARPAQVGVDPGLEDVAEVRDGVAQAGERAVAVDRAGQLGAAGEEDLV
ncbi:MAG: hypothetical protein AVDCRST_MAG13-280 [uncultured Solirubrobacteraceae bacterium]|uniref:Uncharacterized protein n=1 Tax=uncultured Solirubrobacteraceae bacterium TaxID=1162706 RepID=A0A6J4RFV8_9ACTN|nr:MAG: hypothetical protein AVDCRST_MAG13-280 [uncultured Solirubrobacteraceae bacterium]